MTTILLVDDSRAIRLATQRMMSDLDCTLLEAENGQAALDVLQRHSKIDAILLDWNMPVMDGITFLRKVRANPTGPQPKIVMCTTEAEMGRIVDALQAGANEYMMKPFTADIVADKLREVGAI